jgi:effector-binding domain-containing protein
MKRIWGLLLILMTSVEAMGYAAAFERTEPGRAEIKVLPAGRLLEASGDGTYFNQSNALFRPLFRYIQSHGISMTVPVEARIDPGTMYFWVAPDQADKAAEDAGGVRVIDLPERLVAAFGARGGYSEANFNETRKALLDWLRDRRDVAIAGEPYAVYWNGPFTPWFMKQFEVQVAVKRVETEQDG